MIIPPGFCAIFALYTNGAGHHCENVMGYSVDAPLTQTDANNISSALATAYKNQLNSGGHYDGVRILSGQDGGDPTILESTTGNGNGSRGSPLATPQVQGLLKKTTAVSGRHNRGRMFIADMAETQLNDVGGLDSTALGLVQAIGTAWMNLAASAANLGLPMLLHSDSTEPTEVNGMTAETKVATLRRRYER